MQVFKNLLSQESLSSLKDIMELEIKHHTNPDVPKYQSFMDMHTKHATGVVADLILDINCKVNSHYKSEYRVFHCWFNYVDETSDSLGEDGFHIHSDTDVVAVFYVLNCTNHGTIIKVNDARLQLMIEDNSLSVFDGTIDHAIPNWNGKDRYSIALDLQRVK